MPLHNTMKLMMPISKEGELEELSNRIKEVANAQKTLEDLNESIYTLDKDGRLDRFTLQFKKIFTTQLLGYFYLKT